MTDDPRGSPRPSARGAVPSAAPASAAPADAGADGAPDDGTELILDQVFDGDSLYALRAAVAAHASAAGLSRSRCDDAVIAVHELAANAVRHGAGHGQLRAWLAGKTLYFRVTDDGPEAAAAGQPVAAELRTEPGHGLWLVREVADQASLQARADGTTATVSFALQPPARGTALPAGPGSTQPT